MSKKMNVFKLIGILSILMFVLVACGGADEGNSNGDSSDAQQADESATATPFPTFEFVAPTNPPVFNQSAEETEEASDDAEDTEEMMELDPTKVERGLGRYEALECATCHGEAGVGTDDAGALVEFSQAEDDFITFMRTGGDIGNDHQYSTDRLSQNGAVNLYQYLVSLTQGE